MEVLDTVRSVREARGRVAGPVGLVPTMGSLHEGHLELVRRARRENGLTAVSIFVNPSQFGPGEDLGSYPRDMDRDLGLLTREGVDLVFAPSPEEMYPAGFDTWIQVKKTSEVLEGAARPGHFQGVATVVAKLFNIVRPHRAYFGQKDGQQAAVVSRMVKDLDMDVEIVAVPTVREEDGLAMSSRNVYLTPEERQAAPVVYRALSRAVDLWRKGETGCETLRAEMKAVLESESLVSGVDYVSVADPITLEELVQAAPSAMVSTAVHIGKARLIDNVLLE